MSFFREIGKSIYGPDFYQDLLKKPASYSVKYFALFIFVFTLLFSLRYGALLIPGLNSALNDLGPAIKSNFPSELEVKIEKGKASTNVSEPYILELSKDWEARNGVKDTPENLIVIDTGSDPSPKKLEEYNTSVLLTEEYLVYKEENNKISIQSLKNFPDMVVSQVTVSQFYDRYSPYLNFIYPLFFMLIFLGGIMYAIMRLVYLLFGALIVWAIVRSRGIEVSYGKSYQLGLHLMTLPILLALIPLSVPFSFTLVLLIVAFVNIKKTKSSSQTFKHQGEESEKGVEKVIEVSPVNPDSQK